MTETDVLQLNPVTLAFVGDAEFTLFVRSMLVSAHDFKSGELTRMANKMVSAVSQAAMYGAVLPYLTEREADVAKRARNTRTPSHAKNAGLADYKRATALEAVFGFLSLTGARERLAALMDKCAGEFLLSND